MDLLLSFRALLKIPDVVLLISLCRWSRKPFLLKDHSKSIEIPLVHELKHSFKGQIIVILDITSVRLRLV